MIKPTHPRLEGSNFEGDEPATKGRLLKDIKKFPSSDFPEAGNIQNLGF